LRAHGLPERRGCRRQDGGTHAATSQLIERRLIEEAVRPISFFMRQGTCRRPEVKGLTLDVRLDK
jgi:hypothetical protein